MLKFKNWISIILSVAMMMSLIVVSVSSAAPEEKKGIAYNSYTWENTDVPVESVVFADQQLSFQRGNKNYSYAMALVKTEETYTAYRGESEDSYCDYMIAGDKACIRVSNKRQTAYERSQDTQFNFTAIYVRESQVQQTMQMISSDEDIAESKEQNESAIEKEERLRAGLPVMSARGTTHVFASYDGHSSEGWAEAENNGNGYYDVHQIQYTVSPCINTDGVALWLNYENDNDGAPEWKTPLSWNPSGLKRVSVSFNVDARTARLEATASGYITSVGGLPLIHTDFDVQAIR